MTWITYRIFIRVIHPNNTQTHSLDNGPDICMVINNKAFFKQQKIVNALSKLFTKYIYHADLMLKWTNLDRYFKLN